MSAGQRLTAFGSSLLDTDSASLADETGTDNQKPAKPIRILFDVLRSAGPGTDFSIILKMSPPYL